MSLKAAKQFVDPLLYKTIEWLTNEKLYREAKKISDDDRQKMCFNSHI